MQTTTNRPKYRNAGAREHTVFVCMYCKCSSVSLCVHCDDDYDVTVCCCICVCCCARRWWRSANDDDAVPMLAVDAVSRWSVGGGPLGERRLTRCGRWRGRGGGCACVLALLLLEVRGADAGPQYAKCVMFGEIFFTCFLACLLSVCANVVWYQCGRLEKNDSNVAADDDDGWTDSRSGSDATYWRFGVVDHSIFLCFTFSCYKSFYRFFSNIATIELDSLVCLMAINMIYYLLFYIII